MSSARPLSAERQAKYEHEADAIMRAAYRVIGRSEGGGCSVHDILGEAGLSTRAFYRHFKSKDEVILAMYRQAYERVAAELNAVATSADGPRAAFEAWVQHHLAVAYDPKRAARSLVLRSAEVRNARGFAEVHQESVRVLRAGLVEILTAGREAGVFPLADPVEDARAVQSVISGLIDARLGGAHGPSKPVAREHTVSLFLRAFGAVPTHAGLDNDK